MSSENVGPHLLYTGIRVRNLARSMKFYRALGLRPSMKGTMKHGGKWVWMRDRKTRQILELNWYPKGNEFYEKWKAGVELDHLGWTVRDVERVITKMKKVGCTVEADFVQGNVRLVFFRDPDGVWHEFLSWKKSAQKFRRGAPALERVVPTKMKARL